MITVFPCYAPAERENAASLAEFISRAADVEVYLDEGELRPSEDLVGKAREARQADVAVVLVSPDSTPSKWDRAQWEPALMTEPEAEGTRIAFWLCRDCRFPAVLRRQHFFEGPNAMRAIKRWLRQPLPEERGRIPAENLAFRGREAELEVLGIALADRPGSATLAHSSPEAGKTALALEFARRFSDDFDAVFWTHCGLRSPAEIVGDLGAQLGLKLEGEPGDSAGRIMRFCEERRFLLIFDDVRDADTMTLSPGGRASALFTTSIPEIAVCPIRIEPVDVDWPEVAPEAQHLLQAFCACAPEGTTLEVAAQTASMRVGEADRAGAALRNAGLLLNVDERSRRYFVPSIHRVPASMAPATGATVGDLRHACRLALAAGMWSEAKTLARRTGTLAREGERFAELFELMREMHDAAEAREDRKALEEFAGEMVWLLEYWDRYEEAASLQTRIGTLYADQMTLF